MENFLNRRQVLSAVFVGLSVVFSGVNANVSFADTASRSETGATVLLDARSENNLKGVHPDLVKVVRRAAGKGASFRVNEGARDAKRQETLVKSGASTTMNSRHIPGKDGWSKAVDLVAVVDGKISWSWKHYEAINKEMQKAAKELGVTVEWGGDWKSFKDGPHFQLPRKAHP